MKQRKQVALYLTDYGMIFVAEYHEGNHQGNTLISKPTMVEFDLLDEDEITEQIRKLDDDIEKNKIVSIQLNEKKRNLMMLVGHEE